MKKIKISQFLILSFLFFAIGISSFIYDKNLNAFLSSSVMALIGLFFHFTFKIKLEENEKNSLIKGCNELKIFGKKLPLKFISKLQILWLFLLIICMFKFIVKHYFSFIPDEAFTVISNLSFGMFFLGSFYQLFQGNLKGFSISMIIFSRYWLLNIFITYIFYQKVVSTYSMILCIISYCLYKIVSPIFKVKKENKDSEEVKI